MPNLKNILWKTATSWIIKYISPILLDVTKTSVDDFETVDDLYDAVGAVLHEATENDDEDDIKNICNGIINLIRG